MKLKPGLRVVTSEVESMGKVEFSFPEIWGRLRFGVSVNDDVTPPVVPDGEFPGKSVVSGLIWNPYFENQIELKLY